MSQSSSCLRSIGNEGRITEQRASLRLSPSTRDFAESRSGLVFAPPGHSMRIFGAPEHSMRITVGYGDPARGRAREL